MQTPPQARDDSLFSAFDLRACVLGGLRSNLDFDKSTQSKKEFQLLGRRTRATQNSTPLMPHKTEVSSLHEHHYMHKTAHCPNACVRAWVLGMSANEEKGNRIPTCSTHYFCVSHVAFKLRSRFSMFFFWKMPSCSCDSSTARTSQGLVQLIDIRIESFVHQVWRCWDTLRVIIILQIHTSLMRSTDRMTKNWYACVSHYEKNNGHIYLTTTFPILLYRQIQKIRDVPALNEMLRHPTRTRLVHLTNKKDKISEIVYRLSRVSRKHAPGQDCKQRCSRTEIKTSN